MKRVVQSSVSQNTRPYERLGLNNHSSTQAGESKPEEHSGKSDCNFKAPAKTQAIKDALLSENIGTQTSEEAQVGKDVNEDVFLPHVRIMQNA